ncbi:methyltransferase domain-containing protein [Rhizobium lemnae]|uniref:Class I SAM-dependent methyltransferase n=1 Tax=Rhizobium lemnae TaxID=1214924 RepID=A0ABV8E5W2_9HYPH|nr:class I SAM-dependent methyltransferase [Rhizobium lemnae]MCJ8510638.1 methyltransferase domain-containing protein [Rhizobium lemnae]
MHFAPEPCLASILSCRAKTYLTADLVFGRANIILNIEQIDLPAGSLDLVICSHILEHVDDKLALAELYRVLRPGGIAVLMFPVIEGWISTYENEEVTTPKGRDLHFGQMDHVRYFGRDVRDRITAAGFTLEEFTATEPAAHRHGLMRGEKVFIGKKMILNAPGPVNRRSDR